jgi:hypothetical protein
MFLAMLSDGAEGRGPRAADGSPAGKWVFLADGQLRAEGSFQGGVPQGVWRVWDARGFLRSESHWEDGVPCGRWVTWDAEGQLERVDVKGDVRPPEPLVALAQKMRHETLPV